VEQRSHYQLFGEAHNHAFRFRSLLSGMISAIVLLLPTIVQPANAAKQSSTPTSKPAKITAPIRPHAICPTELEPLTAALLKDLPQYINRLSHQRSGTQARRYAIATTPANLNPLPVVTSYPDPKQGGLYQTFFTLLDRQYLTQRKLDYQSYYWLFLAHTPKAGWQLAILYTRDGSYPANNQISTDLRDATQEVTGLAIRRWLRDCQAGAIQLPESGKKQE